MGVTASLNIYVDCNIEELKEFLIEEIWMKNVIRPYGNIPKISNESILFDAMCITFGSIDEESVEYYNEEYNININHKFIFELYNRVLDSFSEEIKVLAAILKKYSGDCEFSINGYTLLLRKDGEITIDRTEKERLPNLPYKLLGDNYIIDDLNKQSWMDLI